MPVGSPKEFALATGKDHGNVYKAIRKNRFHFTDAELYWVETKKPMVRWKLQKGKGVKNK